MTTEKPQVTRPLRTIPTMVVTVVCVLALGALAWHLWAMPIGDRLYGQFGNGIDTRVSRGGALAVWNDGPLYEGPVYRVWQFTYTPFAAAGFLPLAFLSEWGAMRLMNVVNVLCLLLLVWLSLRALRFRIDWRFVVVVIGFALAVTTLEPVHTTIWNGQINLFLAVLVVADLTLRTGRWRGIGVGIAAGIKLTPIFFVAYLAVTRQWRAICVAVAAFAATVAIGFAVLPGESWTYWTKSLEDTSRIGPIGWPQNQSFNGFFVRLGIMDVVHLPAWTWLPVGVVVAAAGLWAAYRAYRRGATLLAVTLTGMTATGVAPFSWGHHWVWFVPLLLIAIVHAVDQFDTKRPLSWLWWLAPAAIVAFTFCWQREVWRGPVRSYAFGSFRLLWTVHPHSTHGWGGVATAILSGSYLIVLLGTIAVTLWWTRRGEPIRFNATDLASGGSAQSRL